ncbi:WD40/YVTN repeat-like-containing domain [Phytophthora cactorum]|nr:WD40/YVTN repeat-like-containing domain [Phytophthora cactorum]
MAGHGRRKKRRVTALMPQDEEAARCRFLEALEAQRAKARSQQAEIALKTKLHNPSGSTTSPATADYAWSAQRRDNQELIPKVLSGFLSSQVVESQDMDNNDRLTSLALHPRASNLGAVGASNGRLEILGLQKIPPALDRSHLRSVQFPSATFMFQELLRRCSGVQSRSSIFWNPVDPRKFSVGYGGSSRAAYMDAIVGVSSFQHAPTGVITSDVHAQSFFSTVRWQCCVNGTKSGGLWGWDLRTPRRIFEWEGEATPNRPAGSVLDIHMLNDCRRAVVQRSNGELRTVDLRTSKPVVEFMLARLSVTCQICAVLSTIPSLLWLLVAMHVAHWQSTALIYKMHAVQLKSGHYGTRYGNTPEIWAISRNELYVCSGRTDDTNE